jgi:periplasmic protein TonB
MTDAVTTGAFDAAPSALRVSPARAKDRFTAGYRAGAGRPAGLAFVALLHAGLLGAVLLYTGTQTHAIPRQPLDVRTIEEVKPPDAPPPPPPPPSIQAAPPPFIPAPEIVIATQPSAAPPVATSVAPPVPVPVAPAAPAPAAPAKRVQPDIDMRHSSDPLYPAESRRRGEQGLVVLLVLVEADGQPSEIKLEQSSGHDRLDQAAIDGARHNLHYIAGTVDGKPERMWLRYRYNFQLR